jgi:hypothetical protein
MKTQLICLVILCSTAEHVHTTIKSINLLNLGLLLLLGGISGGTGSSYKIKSYCLTYKITDM